MVRFLDKTQITNIATDDIMPITDISDSRNDKKISIGQLNTYFSNNLNSFANKDLSNTNMLTDAILLAPNGVIVASNNNTNIVAKTGMSLLFADGRNADGTFKSLQYTLSGDKTQAISMLNNDDYVIFLTNTGTLSYASQKNVYISRNKPTVTSSTCYWYDIKNNYWKKTTNTGSTWSNIYLNSLGLFTVTNGVITEILPNTVAYIPNPEVLMLKDASNITQEGKELLKDYVDINSRANISLNNLNSTGEGHFANPSLTNLNSNGINNISNFALKNISLNKINTTSGNLPLINNIYTATLTDNSAHIVTIPNNTSNAVTFVLPSVTNNNIFHQMIVLFYTDTVRTINLGTSHYFYNSTPTMTSAGAYTIIYEYDGTNWVAGVIFKG